MTSQMCLKEHVFFCTIDYSFMLYFQQHEKHSRETSIDTYLLDMMTFQQPLELKTITVLLMGHIRACILLFHLPLQLYFLRLRLLLLLIVEQIGRQMKKEQNIRMDRHTDWVSIASATAYNSVFSSSLLPRRQSQHVIPESFATHHNRQFVTTQCHSVFQCNTAQHCTALHSAAF